MFNGIIFNSGKVKSVIRDRNSISISIETNLKFTNKDLGTSISCNGVCLTLIKIKNRLISFYVSNTL